MPAATEGAFEDVPLAKNLAVESRVAAKRHIPVLLVFTAPHCGFCLRVLEEYLIPMLKDPATRNRVFMRRIELGNDGTLIGFDGKETSHMEFASDQHVFLAPTVMFFDAKGNRLAKPIVGLLSPDFYGGYLESAIEEATQAIRGK